MKVTRKEFEKIFEEKDSAWGGNNCYKGLQIIAKYTDEPVHGAGHDVVWSEDIDKLIEKGITRNEVLELAKLNWMIENGEYLACFV